jgi:hypothetical protein
MTGSEYKIIVFVIAITLVAIYLTSCGHQPPGQDLWKMI